MYCDVADVRRRTPSITFSDMPDHVVVTYIEEGQDVIDNWLAKIYPVPFATVPSTIKRVCADIAAYFMMRDFPDKTFQEDLERLEKSYMKELQEIVNGNVILPVDPLPTSSLGVYIYKVESDGERWENTNVGGDGNGA